MEEDKIEYRIRLEYLSDQGEVQCTALGIGFYTSKEEAEKGASEGFTEIAITDHKGNTNWKVRRLVITQEEVKEYYNALREQGRKDLEKRMTGKM